MAHSDASNTGIIGKLHSVSCTDFITYDSVKIFPGQHLNILLGPNGTGKSSLVAAILIGMGGSCKLLSRSADLQDFIKNGKEVAQIEIQIYKNAKRHVTKFYRSFSIDKVHKWAVDGKTVSAKDYLSYVQQFNVQIDNLCQFLPQDRVQDFAKMNPHEVLLNTLKSVCTTEMNEMYNKLISLREQWNSSETDLAENIKRLKELQNRNDEMQAKLDKLTAQKNLILDVKICNAKKAWIEFEHLYLQCKEIEKDLNLAKKAAIDHEKALALHEALRKKYLESKEKYDTAIRTNQEKVIKLRAEINAFDTKFEKMEDDLTRHTAHLRGVLLSVQDQDKEISDNETLLNVYMYDLEKAERETGNSNEIQQKIAKSNEQSRDVRQLETQTLEKRNTLNVKLERDIQPEIAAIKQRINSLENISEARMRLVRQRYNDTYNAILWLRENAHRFQSRICEPAIIEVNVKDAKNAIYIENTVSYRDLIAFICENPQDSINLMNVFREEMNWRLTNVAANEDQTIYQPRIPLEQIRQYGFHAYLIDLIEGPPIILNQLCRLYNLHNIPVGNDYTYENSDKVPTDFRLFFTTRHRISVSFSKYTGQPSTTIQEISPMNLLNVSIDRQQLSTEKEKLVQMIRKSDQMKNLRNEMEAKCQEYSRKVDDFRTTIKELEKKMSTISQCREKITRQEQKIYKLKHSVINIEKEKNTFKSQARVILNKMNKLQIEKIKCIEEFANHTHTLEKEKLKLNIFMIGNENVEQQVRLYRDQVLESKKLVTNVQINLDRKKEVCRTKQTEAKGLTDGKTPSDKRSFPYIEAFKSLPSSLEEIKAKIDDFQARLDCMPQNEQVNMDEFEKQLEMAKKLEESISNVGNDKIKLQTEIIILHNTWFPEISGIIDLINNNFCRFMASMGYAGEIELSKNEDQHDYKSYGIEIRVKYRQKEKIQTLDRYVQSGGERAVAIAIYTLSIQHISQVPFRCVDEINQGMDRRNERKFFEMLVQETCMEGRSQYFFISPKLLPNLSYSEFMTVHVVNNGVGVQKSDLFHLGKAVKC